MKNFNSYAEKHRLLFGLPTNEHKFLYEYLTISPSYFRAHQLISGSPISTESLSSIDRWESVLKTYELCGDVFTQTFNGWWDQRGRKAFYTKQKDEGYLLAGPMSLMTNKVNNKTLIDGISLVHMKSWKELKTGKKIENWRLGMDSSINSKWKQLLKIHRGKTVQNLEARTLLGEIVSKKLKVALWIAENAARGEFPSTKPIRSGLTFENKEIEFAMSLSEQAYAVEMDDMKKNGISPIKEAKKRSARRHKLEAKIAQEVERRIQIHLAKTS